MAVDRGGLQYTITVRDQFSKTTAKFKSEMAASKAAFASLQKGAQQQRQTSESFKKTTKTVDENTAALKRLDAAAKAQAARERTAVKLRNTQQAESTANLRSQAAEAKKITQQQAANLLAEQKAVKASIDAKNAAAKQATKIAQSQKKDVQNNLSDQQKALKAQVDAQVAQEKAAAKLLKAQQNEKKVQQQNDPAFQAQQRLNNGLKEELIQRNQIKLLQAQAKKQFQSGDLLGGSKSLQQAKALQEQLKGVDKAGNSLFFTFRRLVGVLAVFTIARELVSGFQSLIKTGIEFNDTVELATVSIAGLLVAVTDVRDQFGQSLKPAEQLGAAIAVSQDQVKKLRQEGFKTIATFQQLLDTFQVAIAPGFAAGGSLDQIRKFTVSISQAAAAIGLQQNQLAEEIRSILSGTIQARTTRIATALGITNADIRRLKETGKLFDFLQDRFSAFSAAAEKQARSTITGVTSVIQKIVESVLGEAAGPLFDELLKVGNEVIDKVLTIKDAEGNLKPNPEIVKGFEAIFNALKDGLDQLRNVGKDLGFAGLKNILQAVGTALSVGIQFALGFAQTLLETFNAIIVAVKTIGSTFGVTTVQLGKIAGLLGVVLGSIFVWDNTMGQLGIKFSFIKQIILALIPGLGQLGGLAASFGNALKSTGVVLGQIGLVVGVVIVGFDQLLGSIFDVNLSLKETVSLIGKGIAAQVKESIGGFKAIAIAANPTTSVDEKKKQLHELADQLRADTEEFNKEVADIIGKATEREVRGPGFDPAAGFKKSLAEAQKGGKEFSAILSAADSQIATLAASLQALQDDVFKVGEEFKAAFNSQDLQGVGAKIQDLFSAQTVDNAEKLRKIRRDQAAVEQSITGIIKTQGITTERRAAIEKAANSDILTRKKNLEALNLTEPEGQLISLLRDEKDLTEAINEFQKEGVRLALEKAAIIALETSRDLNRENVVAQANLVAERALNQVIVNRLGARRQAVVEAENALNIAKLEASQQEDALQKQLDFVRQKLAVNQTGTDGPTAAERDAFKQLEASLSVQLDTTRSLNDEKQRGLEFAKQEAALVESGTLTQGLQRGFEQVANDLPSAFQAGIEITKQSVQQLTDFISSSIVSAFDPTQDTTIQERFARFLQGIAQIILQQLVQLAIASALQKTLEDTQSAGIEITTATTAAGIKVAAANTAAAIEIAAAQTSAAILAAGSIGLHTGGLVRGFNRGGAVGRGAVATAAHASARGFAAGGFQRPKGLHPADTVPAWLQPGEFVVRKAVVDDLGLGFFKAVNRGSFGVADAAPASGAGAAASAGMAKGGLVSDNLARAQHAGGQAAKGDVQIVPVQVAGEQQLDRILAGGKTSARKFLHDNAGIIRSIAKGG